MRRVVEEMGPFFESIGRFSQIDVPPENLNIRSVSWIDGNFCNKDLVLKSFFLTTSTLDQPFSYKILH